jgi:filamentous hemagglutinin family protein
MKKSWKLAGSFGSSLISRFARRGPRAARKVAAVAGEAVGLDSFGRLIGGLAPALALALITTKAVAGPEGAQVANGNVSIQKQGDKTVIHASNNAIINYKSFDIAKNETVQFVQPDALARVLNRINSPSPTQIDGKLLANGRVFIVNPAGVIFGQGAVVNAAGIYAAAGNITDANFVKGIYKFTNVQGSVTNHGTIEAGNVALVGKSVANTGTIIADKGAVVMASGDSVMIGEQGGRMYVKVDAQQQDTAGGSGASKDNSGGGWAVGDIYSLSIRNSGTIKGKTVHAEAAKGVVNIGGTVDASSQTAGEKGGSVKILGDYVGVSGTVDASGPAGGGEILIGGNFQGKGVEKNAVRTAVTSTAKIKADATSNGDGGRVIVWADDQTNFTGSLSARGTGTGKGGFAEVSGKENLNFTWNVDLSGPGGVGELLLDPATITITGGTSDGGSDGTDTFFGDPSANEGVVEFTDIGPTHHLRKRDRGPGRQCSGKHHAPGDRIDRHGWDVRWWNALAWGYELHPPDQQHGRGRSHRPERRLDRLYCRQHHHRRLDLGPQREHDHPRLHRDRFGQHRGDQRSWKHHDQRSPVGRWRQSEPHCGERCD